MALAAIGTAGAMWRGMRKLEDVTDEDLVNVVAGYGMRGSGDLDDYEVATEVLTKLGCVDEEGYTDDDEVEALDGRLDSVEGRIRKDDGCGLFFCLTWEEWGRRLEGKSAAEIAELLKGSAS